MLFSNRKNHVSNNPKIFLNNFDISFVDRYNFLGVVIDNSLKFHLHISECCNKVSKSIGILYKIRYNAPKRILIHLYYSFVYPYLSYCITLWGGTDFIYLDKIFLLQKKSIRIIVGAAYLDHSGPLFKECKIIPKYI